MKKKQIERMRKQQQNNENNYTGRRMTAPELQVSVRKADKNLSYERDDGQREHTVRYQGSAKTKRKQNCLNKKKG
jgi:hypothetical protein